MSASRPSPSIASDDPTAFTKGGNSADHLAQLATLGPISIRNFALLTLSIFASIFMLNWAKTILVPIALSVLIAYSLDPVVSWLKRQCYLPRFMGTGLLMLALLGVITFASYALQNQTTEFLDRLPQAVENASRSWRSPSPSAGVIEKVNETAKQIEKATEEATGGQETDPEVTRVRIEEPVFSFRGFLWSSYPGALAFLGQSATVVILVYLFLVTGHLYKRKLVKLVGPSMSRKRIMLLILNDLNGQIKRYLFVLLISGIFVGVVTWLGLWWIGLEQAVLWGIVAGIASAIPYLGPAVVFVATFLVGLLQFGSLTVALVAAIITLVVTSFQGMVLTPWLTSKTSRINAVTVFIGLLFWGWLWGPLGLLMGTPLTIIFKVCCDHISNLRGMGILMED